MSDMFEIEELQMHLKEEAESYPLLPVIALAYHSVLKDCELHCFNEGNEVKRLGGLHVIGTSLHESRRIDNQASCRYKHVETNFVVIRKSLTSILDISFSLSST
jgi:hypothetical protein